jgi:ABC-type lipoprotein release transport system permease subunit
MKFADLISDVFLNLTRKKMRTALTMVGVVIGAVAVVTTVSLGHGLSAFLDQQVRAVANPLTVEAWPKKGASPDKVARGMFKSIGRAPQEIKKEKEDEFVGAFEIKTVEDEMMQKLEQIEGVDRVRPKVFVLARSFQLNGDPREFDAIVVPWIDAGPQVLSEGSVFSDDNATECIVSEAYLESLRTINRADPIWKDVPEEEIKALEGIVEPEDLIGKTITIRVVKHPMLALAGQGNMDMSAFDDLRGLLFLLRNPPQDFQLFLTELFLKLRELQNSEAIKAMSESEEEPIAFEAKVVGIAKKGLLTNIIYVPDEFAAEMGRVLFDNPEMYTEKNWGMGVVLLAKDKADVQRIKTEVKEMGFRAHTMEDIIGKLHAFFATLQSVLVIFGGIAFFVATFSIVNTLLMAVMERKREIGVLQALGATRAHIMKIFACEAAAIGLLGGLLGGLAGWLLIQGGNAFAHYKWGHIIASADIFVMPVWLFPVLLIFTTLLGLGAGVYPAYRASRLDPVAALRYE